MRELKNCPFCGTKAVSSVFSIDVYNWYEEKVCCENCSCIISHPQAIQIWNTRPAEDAKDKEIERLKKQVAGREDEGYAGFIIGVEQMKKKLAEKDKEIERLKEEVRKLATELNNINILTDNIMNEADFGSKATKAEMHSRLTSIYVYASHIKRALARTDDTTDTGKMEG